MQGPEDVPTDVAMDSQQEPEAFVTSGARARIRDGGAVWDTKEGWERIGARMSENLGLVVATAAVCFSVTGLPLMRRLLTFRVVSRLQPWGNCHVLPSN